MHRSSRSIRGCLGLGLGLAASLFAATGMAQGAPVAPPVQSRQDEGRLQKLCADTPCSPPVLAGRYRIIEGPFAGSELRLDAGSRYSLSLERSVMKRRFSGQWQLGNGYPLALLMGHGVVMTRVHFFGSSMFKGKWQLNWCPFTLLISGVCTHCFWA